MINFSTVIALDQSHLSEFRHSWQTWSKFRPEILSQPLVIMYDNDQPISWWLQKLEFCQHPDRRFYPVYPPPQCTSQREKMLSSFVLLAPKIVDTPWILKLDVDAFARHADPKWCSEELIAEIDGVTPVFCTNPWGYTKPAEWIPSLEEWAQNVPGLKEFPPLGLRATPGWSRLPHPRIISWCFFGNTEWCLFVANRSPKRLPVASHDTYLWYWAARSQQKFRREKMKRYGWDHHQGSRLAKEVRKVMNMDQPLDPPPIIPPADPEYPILNVSMGKKRRVQHIPTWREVVQSIKPLVGVEIGVAYGSLSEHVLRTFPKLTLHMVDAWATYNDDHPYTKTGDTHALMKSPEKEKMVLDVKTRVAFAGDRAVIHRMNSEDAAKLFQPKSLDFVFVDADHSYQGVIADLHAWGHLVRPGGILGGHDYDHPRDRRGLWGVKKAVTEYAEKMGLKIQIAPNTIWWARMP